MTPLRPYEIINIYDNGDDYLNALIPMIQSAKQSVFIESYIFELPEPGNKILTVLELKQKEGLDVRILVDGVGSLRHLPNLQSWSEKTWIPLRIYNPLPWSHEWRVLLFPFFLLKLILNTQSLNKRDHRKIVLIDNRIAFLGSVNFSKSHFKAYSPHPWFDLTMQIQGTSVSLLSQAFLKEFNRTMPTRHDVWQVFRLNFKHRFKWFPMEQKIRLNSHFLLRFLYWRDLLQRIRNAKKRVYIMNAYFVPHRTLIQSLIYSARKGVDVVILLPGETDVPLVKWFAPIFYRKFLQTGVQIWELKSPMLHTKSIIIDDWGLIGSNNLNYRSLIHDLEAEAVVDTPPMFQKLLQIWNHKLSLSNKIHYQDVMNISWWSWLRYRCILLFRYFV